MKVYCLTLFFISFNCLADIPIYQSTDNTGINKAERIDTVESYLIALSKSIKAMESKLDENAKKINNLDTIVKAMVDADKAAAEKLSREKSAEKKNGANAPDTAEIAEMEKVKSDILALKNEDLDKLKRQFSALDETVKAIQATMHDQVRFNSQGQKFGTKPQ